MTKKTTLMLVDDDEDDREVFMEVLESISPEASCLLAVNGRDALAKLKTLESTPEIIFLDLNMPLMDGRQFLREVKTRPTLRNIPIVVLTTTSDKATMTETISLGAKDFVTKPVRYSDWRQILRSFI